MTISYIIPVFNIERYIRKCVESIIASSTGDYEIILVDDGSTDSSGHICDELASENSRVSAYHQPNCGAGSAREFGVKNAHGDWIMFVDGDDEITPNGVKYLSSVCSFDYDIICGAINHDGLLFGHKRDGVFSKEEYIKTLLRVETTDGPVAKLFRRELFAKSRWHTPHGLNQNEDMLMLIALAVKAGHVYLTSDVVCYNYNTRQGSLSFSTQPIEKWILLFDKIEEQISSLWDENADIKKAFCEYRLHRLYKGLVRCGKRIEKHPYVKNLIQECKAFQFDEKEMHYINVLQSGWKSNMEYIYYKLKLYHLKDICHKLNP